MSETHKNIPIPAGHVRTTNPSIISMFYVEVKPPIPRWELLSITVPKEKYKEYKRKVNRVTVKKLASEI